MTVLFEAPESKADSPPLPWGLLPRCSLCCHPTLQSRHRVLVCGLTSAPHDQQVTVSHRDSQCRRLVLACVLVG
jgi:hypothetical protein